MLINIWGIVLNHVKRSRNAAIILLFLNLAAIIWAVIDMHQKDTIEDFFLSHAYLTMLCANAFAKLSLCILIIVYGYHLQDSLHMSKSLLESMTPDEISIKLLMLRRIKIVLAVSYDFIYLLLLLLLLLLLVLLLRLFPAP